VPVTDAPDATTSVRRAHRLVGVAFGFAVVCALALIAVVVWPGPDEYNPLGDYPEQSVDPAVVSLSAPNPTVVVTGTKCANEATRTVGQYSFQSVDPPGTIVLAGLGGPTDRAEGCVTQTFRNPLPDLVVQRVMREGAAITWRLVGQETPIAPDGTEGQTRYWASEQFKVVP
jgi:hypothetical protein